MITIHNAMGFSFENKYSNVEKQLNSLFVVIFADVF